MKYSRLAHEPDQVVVFPMASLSNSEHHFISKNILKFKVMYNHVFFSDKFTKYNKIKNRSCF